MPQCLGFLTAASHHRCIFGNARTDLQMIVLVQVTARQAAQECVLLGKPRFPAAWRDVEGEGARCTFTGRQL